ncbi:hypothetical protein P692DRAFT_20784477 [Suillus brevipes Sb2]|nr:hypothetical protein P692DRAFT_20784477 [Suillus brevipes Sb2]
MDVLFQLSLFPSKISKFKKYVNDVASAATSLRDVVKGATEQRGISFDSVLEEFQNTFRALIEELKEQFPPPEEAPGHEKRTLVINAVLNRMEGTFLRIAIKHGANEEVLKNHTSSLMASVLYIVVTIIDLFEQHPELALTLLRIATGIFTQEFLFAALRIFGFAALGPTKGSAAAWLQAWLFGPAVPKGSWFSVLQRIPMARAKL